MRTPFWDVEFASRDPERHISFIIERALEYGDDDAIQWIVREFPGMARNSRFCVQCEFQKLWPYRFQKFCPPHGGAEWEKSITASETPEGRRSHMRQSAGMVVLN